MWTNSIADATYPGYQHSQRIGVLINTEGKWLRYFKDGQPLKENIPIDWVQNTIYPVCLLGVGNTVQLRGYNHTHSLPEEVKKVLGINV